MAPPAEQKAPRADPRKEPPERPGLQIYLFEPQSAPQRRHGKAVGEDTEMKDKILKTEKVDWRKLKPFQPKELKKTTPERLAKLKKSLEENGFAAPFYVWQRGKEIVSLDGHHRLMVLPEMVAEGKKVPEKLTCCFLDVKNEKEARMVFMAYQSHYAQMTAEGFADFTAELNLDTIAKSFEPFTLKWGFKNTSTDTVESNPMPNIKDAITKHGDLFVMVSPNGCSHILACANSCEKSSWDLIEVSKDDMIFTSPPYAIEKSARIKQKYVKGSTKVKKVYLRSDTVDDWFRLMSDFTDHSLSHGGGAAINVQMLADNKKMLLSWLDKNSSRLSDVCIWEKNVAAPQMQKNVLNNNFEFIVILNGKGNVSRSIPFAEFHGNEPNIVKVKKSVNPYSSIHGAIMPKDLAAWAVRLFVKAKAIVDPFSGTGTTLIACEDAKRNFRGLEIEPHYCDVILKRWINHVPKGNITRNGKEFSI